MNIIDTHNHIYLEEFDIDRDELVKAAKKSGIDTLLLPNVDITTVEPMLKVCETYPDFAYPMMGLHPTSVDKNYKTSLKTIESYLDKHKYYGIGEIGIDLYWDKSFLKEQKEVFEEQLRWSADLHLPVVIHSREGHAEVMDSIHHVGADKLRGIFHSFTGNSSELKEILTLETFKIGINGVVTFKNSKLSDVLQDTNLKHIVIETDAPYLSPVPYRGKRNEPTYIWKTAEKIAEIYNVPLEKVVKMTRKNSLEMFNIVNKIL